MLFLFCFSFPKQTAAIHCNKLGNVWLYRCQRAAFKAESASLILCYENVFAAVRKVAWQNENGVVLSRFAFILIVVLFENSIRLRVQMRHTEH